MKRKKSKLENMKVFIIGHVFLLVNSSCSEAEVQTMLWYKAEIREKSFSFLHEFTVANFFPSFRMVCVCIYFLVFFTSGEQIISTKLKLSIFFQLFKYEFCMWCALFVSISQRSNFLFSILFSLLFKTEFFFLMTIHSFFL